MLLALTATAAVSASLLLGFSRAVPKEPGKSKETVTYAKNVSRIMQDRCQSCHHTGTAAPFTLAVPNALN